MLMAIAIMLSSCGHNLGLVGIGTGWRVGNGEYGLSYGDGIFGTFVTKDGVQFIPAPYLLVLGGGLAFLLDRLVIVVVIALVHQHQRHVICAVEVPVP